MYMNVREIMALTVEQNNKLLEQNKQLQKENRELREQLDKNRKLTLEYINSGTKYLKVLDYIEKEIKKEQCENCEFEVTHCDWCENKDILDVIKKVKGSEK